MADITARLEGDLLAPLKAMQSRERLRVFLLAVPVAVAAGAIAAMAGRAAGLDPALLYAFIALSALLGGALVVLGSRIGSLSLMARRADRDMVLSERLSTALELLTRRTASGPVAEALLEDASARVSSVTPRRLVPLTSAALGTAAIAALVLIIIALVLPNSGPAEVAVSEAGVAEQINTYPPADLSGQDISLLADVLAEDAASQSNAYLAAVAEAVENLAAQAENLTPEELSARLEALLDQARQAYGDRQPGWLPAEGESMEGLAASINRLSDSRQDADAPVDPNAPRTMSEIMAAGDMYERDEAIDDRAIRADELAAESAANAETRQASEGEAPPGESGGFEARPITEDMQSIGAQPVGASQDSQQGGNMAGLGSQELAEDPAFADAADLAVGDDVIVSANPDEPGSRIEMQMAPQTEDVVAAGGIPSDRDFARQREEAVAREPVGSDAAAVIARYFARDSQTGGF